MGFKRGRAGHTVYPWRHGVTSEVAVDHDRLPATSSLSRSRKDTEPEDTFSICFTTHGHSYTLSSERQRRYGRQPRAHADSCANTHAHKSWLMSSAEPVWPRRHGWTLAHPQWFIWPHGLTLGWLLADGQKGRGHDWQEEKRRIQEQKLEEDRQRRKRERTD